MRYVGEIKTIAGAKEPSGWLFCDGRELQISLYPKLFLVIGYRYGGAGGYFLLPDLQGRMPIGAECDECVGQQAGKRDATLVAANLPTHALRGASVYGNNPALADLLLSTSRTGTYSGGESESRSISQTEKGTPFSIMPPTLSVNFIISYKGRVA